MSGRKTSLPTSNGSLLLTRDILIACIEKHACWSGLQWAFGSTGPRTVKELAELDSYARWCVNYYVLPRPHREELYMLTGYSRMRGGRDCFPGGYFEKGVLYNWPTAGRVRTVADMYPAAKRKGGVQ